MIYDQPRIDKAKARIIELLPKDKHGVHCLEDECPMCSEYNDAWNVAVEACREALEEGNELDNTETDDLKSIAVKRLGDSTANDADGDCELYRTNQRVKTGRLRYNKHETV